MFRSVSGGQVSVCPECPPAPDISLEVEAACVCACVCSPGRGISVVCGYLCGLSVLGVK